MLGIGSNRYAFGCLLSLVANIIYNKAQVIKIVKTVIIGYVQGLWAKFRDCGLCSEIVGYVQGLWAMFRDFGIFSGIVGFVCRVAEWYQHSLPTLKTGVQIPSEAGSPGHQAVIGTGFILEFNLGGYQ